MAFSLSHPVSNGMIPEIAVKTAKAIPRPMATWCGRRRRSVGGGSVSTACVLMTLRTLVPVVARRPLPVHLGAQGLDHGTQRAHVRPS